MKKLVLLFSLFCSISVMAQQPIRVVYCELLGTQNMFNGKVSITVDFGQENQMWKSQKLVGEDGKTLKFNSMIDAMNWMGEKGWRFVQAYAITMGNTNVYHWLLSKEITEDESISDGFQTRTQYKQEQKEHQE